MKLLYIAFGQSAHTIRWINYFKSKHQIKLISFYNAPPIDGVDLEIIEVKNKNIAFLKLPKVNKVINDFQPDIVHAHYATSCGLVAALTKFSPYVLSVWGDDILNFPQKSPIHKWIVKYAINSADFVTATSQMLLNSTRKLLNNNKAIELIPFGVDLYHYKVINRCPSDTISIGTVRNLTPKYGLEYLIRAVAAIINFGYKVNLTIVGDGRIRGQLESLSAELNISNKVKFAGAVPNEKVVEFLNNFDIFAIPSVGEGETFGVAAVEAMATGLPVIASKVGGLPEVVDDGVTGFHSIPGDVQSIVEPLISYIKSPELRVKHGLAGRKKVEDEFDWAENAMRMEKLYQRIIKN